MLEPYRTKQIRKIASELSFDFSHKDERGIIQLVKDCSMRLSSNQLSHKCISNIMISRDIWDGRATYVFDILTASDEYPLKTMMLVRSKEFDFPFISLQPKIELFPPKQRILKRRRKREISTIHPEKGRIRKSHVVYTTDEAYWHTIKNVLGVYASQHTQMFLELHNFFFFFVVQRRHLNTTKVSGFVDTGIELADRLHQVKY